MAIEFDCEHCGKKVKAPDEAAGKRGKCPHCHQSNYIPAPVGEADVLPLAPIDEDEQRKAAQERRRLREKEEAFLRERGGVEPPPLEHREDLTADDLHHFVVNYCLDLVESNLERAESWAAKLKGFGATGRQAVADFLDGKVQEDALKDVPPPVLKGFLTQLRNEIQ